jgi:Cys-tRNA synthase (O-phospho-L-seryl-tRNA:Cys-tRNA synthase)
MKENNMVFLDSQRGHYITLTKAGFIQNLTNDIRQQLLDVIREEFNPGYLCCLHCQGDVAEMVRYAFTQYDLKLEEYGKEQNTIKDTTGSRRARKAAPKH